MKKIKLNQKLALKKDVVSTLEQNEMRHIIGGVVDKDTPTINDNCDFTSTSAWPYVPCGNTFLACNPHDWCGYNHETNCAGPLITVPS